MKNIDNIVVKESTSILDVIKIIDRNTKQIAIVVDDNKETVRLNLGKVPFSPKIKKSINDDPLYCT